MIGARLRRVLVCTGVLACLAVVCPPTTRSEPRGQTTGAPAAVIPPGQEDLLAAMLGRGVELPAGCGFSTGQIERSVVRGTYICPGGEVAIELRHLSAAPADALRTEKIAIVTARGTPPTALLAALQERILQREIAFEWLIPKVQSRAPGHTSFPLPEALDRYVPDYYPRFAAVLLGLGQTLVIVLGLACGLLRLYRTPRSSDAG